MSHFLQYSNVCYLYFSVPLAIVIVGRDVFLIAVGFYLRYISLPPPVSKLSPFHIKGDNLVYLLDILLSPCHLVIISFMHTVIHFTSSSVKCIMSHIDGNSVINYCINISLQYDMLIISPVF